MKGHPQAVLLFRGARQVEAPLEVVRGLLESSVTVNIEEISTWLHWRSMPLASGPRMIAPTSARPWARADRNMRTWAESRGVEYAHSQARTWP